VARNTFLITKYIPTTPTPLEQQWADDVLRYGQRIRLLANPMAQVGIGSKFHQMVKPAVAGSVCRLLEVT
jgi:hypothetical protein